MKRIFLLLSLFTLLSGAIQASHDPSMDQAKAKPAEHQEESQDCSICLEKLANSEELTTLTCSTRKKAAKDHKFHTDCIKQWLTPKNAKCPSCNTLVPEAKLIGIQDSEEKALALVNLGRAFRLGASVDENHVAARDYNNQVIAMGQQAGPIAESWALAELGHIHKSGRGVEKDLVAAHNRYNQVIAMQQRAAPRARSWALVGLAQMYKDGVGVEKNHETAFDYYHQVIAMGQQADPIAYSAASTGSMLLSLK